MRCYHIENGRLGWPTAAEIESASLQRFEKRKGIIWYMYKSETDESSSVLQSRVYFSTSEYAMLPDYAVDLFAPLIDQIQQIWRESYRACDERLSIMVSSPCPAKQ